MLRTIKFSWESPPLCKFYRPRMRSNSATTLDSVMASSVCLSTLCSFFRYLTRNSWNGVKRFGYGWEKHGWLLMRQVDEKENRCIFTGTRQNVKHFIFVVWSRSNKRIWGLCLCSSLRKKFCVTILCFPFCFSFFWSEEKLMWGLDTKRRSAKSTSQRSKPSPSPTWSSFYNVVSTEKKKAFLGRSTDGTERIRNGWWSPPNLW